MDDPYAPSSYVSLIVPHLYITNWISSADPDVLAQYQIKAILAVETEKRGPEARALYRRMGIEFEQMFLEDVPWADIRPLLDPSYEFIYRHVNQGINTLVHCRVGASRS